MPIGGHVPDRGRCGRGLSHRATRGGRPGLHCPGGRTLQPRGASSPGGKRGTGLRAGERGVESTHRTQAVRPDRKSTRLNSSHVKISYAVFCLKKKKKNSRITAAHTRKTKPK